MDPLVLGLDVGGTSSRAVVTTPGGDVVGRGGAGGGNPLAVAPDRAAAEVARALAAALAGVDPARIAAAVLGLAGVGGFGQSATAAAFRKVWDGAGLTCEVHALGDAQVAFASGTDDPDGTVLIGGTGAAAARIEHGAITRVGDGLGWLLGDRGSGFWIGRRAAADTAAALQTGRPATALTALVAAALTGAAETDADAFVTAVHRREPRSLDRLAPLVTEAALAGDAGAAAILDEAADHLADAVALVRGPGETTPIVLCGSVLARCAPVRGAVRARLAASWPEATVADAGAAELGAARLAARLLARDGR